MRICKLDRANQVYGTGGPSMDFGWTPAPAPSPVALAGRGGSTQTFSATGGGSAHSNDAASASAGIGQWAHDNTNTLGVAVGTVVGLACDRVAPALGKECATLGALVGAAAADARHPRPDPAPA